MAAVATSAEVLQDISMPQQLTTGDISTADTSTAMAVVYDHNGGPEVLRLVRRPLPDPAPREVRVRVHRSGVNPTDWKARQGGGETSRVEPPQVPNQDGSGVVDAVGPGVDPDWRGRRVWLWEAAYQRAHGTAQEFTVIPIRQVVKLPDNASFDLGATLGIPFITAHRCLTVTEEGPNKLGPGTLNDRVVFVAGGAGAVGNAAIQLARWSDATVITTVSSPEKATLATTAGADHVLIYTEQDVAAEVHRISSRGVDTVVEVSPAVNAALDAEILARFGSVAMYANNGGDQVMLPVGALMTPNARWQFVLVYTAPDQAKAVAIEDLTAAASVGAVRVGEDAGLPLHHFSLDQTAEAHAAVENSIIGKVLIDVTDVSD
jgi:NADPH2:quinone reductase